MAGCVTDVELQRQLLIHRFGFNPNNIHILTDRQATQRDQEAADTNFSGFSAGAFTYLMTQYLWQEMGGVGNAIATITQIIKPFSSQVPLAESKP